VTKAKKIQAIRGMHDSLPAETVLWQQVEDVVKRVLNRYGYSEIRLPIVEQSQLFKRAIGEMTDVVEKEIYSFDDRNGENLTLRPEGTAGCIRAGIEHGLLYNQQQRLWYIGPMFRHERPQKGRYRQFHQLGAEVFGLSGPDIDAELIMLTARCWCELAISDHVELELNSIGSLQERARYRDALVAFLEIHKNKLDEDCQRRMYVNPLRVLDSKNPNIQQLLHDAPALSECLDEKSKQHFVSLCAFLDQTNIKYKVNPRLVRGLDYYNHTVFEWITKNLGAQGTICAGGRYDELVEQLGGQATPGIGFSMGLERLILLVQAINPNFTAAKMIDVYLIASGEGTQSAAIQLAEDLRNKIPSLKLMTHHGGGKIARQFSRAEQCRARFALVLGSNELSTRKVTLKNLATGEQETLQQADIAVHLAKLLT